MSSAQKTPDDLPRFRISQVRPCESNKDYFECAGEFDRAEDVVEGLCSLLIPSADVLTALHGYLQFGSVEKAARFYTLNDVPAEAVDQDLTYVHPRWHPRHVWMVSLPTWKWRRSEYAARDGVGKIVEGTQMSVVDGEEVRQWIQVWENGKDSSLSRYYPVFPSGKSSLRIGPDGTIKGGWTHSHCELCNRQIDAGTYGYIDPSEHWVCESCYEKYVKDHNLAFMFE